MVKPIKFTRFQILVHLTAILLAAGLGLDALRGNLTVNPIQAAMQRTGRYAIYFLIFSLACTPLNTIFGWRQALSARRPAGLYAFFFAATHFSIFIGIDYAFDFKLLLADVGTKRYILVGAAALVILTPLALTSFKWWMKKLGKNWKRLHSLVYGAGLLAVLHYAWAKKGDLFSLQGDILVPAAFLGLLLVLLTLRFAWVRKWVSNNFRRVRNTPPAPAD